MSRATTPRSGRRPAFPEIAGGLVAWMLRAPAVPLRVAGRHYRGPGSRVLVDWGRLVDCGATEAGNLVTEVLGEGERALLCVAQHLGALPEEEPSGHGHRGVVPATEPTTGPEAA